MDSQKELKDENHNGVNKKSNKNIGGHTERSTNQNRKYNNAENIIQDK